MEVQAPQSAVAPAFILELNSTALWRMYAAVQGTMYEDRLDCIWAAIENHNNRASSSPMFSNSVHYQILQELWHVLYRQSDDVRNGGPLVLSAHPYFGPRGYLCADPAVFTLDPWALRNAYEYEAATPAGDETHIGGPAHSHNPESLNPLPGADGGHWGETATVGLNNLDPIVTMQVPSPSNKFNDVALEESPAGRKRRRSVSTEKADDPNAAGGKSPAERSSSNPGTEDSSNTKRLRW